MWRSCIKLNSKQQDLGQDTLTRLFHDFSLKHALICKLDITIDFGLSDFLLQPLWHVRVVQKFLPVPLQIPYTYMYSESRESWYGYTCIKKNEVNSLKTILNWKVWGIGLISFILINVLSFTFWNITVARQSIWRYCYFCEPNN